jgi:hypothetical protein
MIVKDKRSNDPRIYKIQTKALKYYIERMLFQHIQKIGIELKRTVLSKTWFSIPYPRYDLSKTQVIADFDIINLHWVAECARKSRVFNLNCGEKVKLI